MCKLLVDDSVIKFEQNRYEVMEDISLENGALEVCLSITDLTAPRIITMSPLPRVILENIFVTAEGMYIRMYICTYLPV